MPTVESEGAEIMRYGAREHAEAFPNRCEVRGCDSPPQEWFESDDHVFDVCSTHGLQLRAGEARTIKDDELLVGSDAAAELISIRSRWTPTGTVLTLQLGHHGVIDREVPLKVTPTFRHSIRTVLRSEDDPDEGPER